MTVIDIIILILVGMGAVMGFIKGFVRQLASILGLIIGLLAARALYVPLAEKLCPSITNSMTMAQILAFVIIWLAVPLAFALMASLLTKLIEAISLGGLNHCLGAGIGVLKSMLLISLVICVIEFVDGNNKFISQTTKEKSSLYYPIGKLAGVFVPAAKEVTQQYILQK